jgi:dolichol-phosphate mannosyltransferase
MPEQNRSFGLLALWVGYSRKEVLIDHAPRLSGTSNYNFRKRYRLAIDSLISYSNKVLNLTVYCGLFISFIAFLAAVLTLVRYILYGNPASGWTSTIIVILFSIGIQLTALGVLALYIGKIYDEVKKRPLYLIEKIYQGGKTQHEH